MNQQRSLRWQALMGDFVFRDANVIYRGGTYHDIEENQPRPLSGFAISDSGFPGGGIDTEVTFDPAESLPTAQIVFAYDPATSEMATAGITGSRPGFARYAFMLFSGFSQSGGWRRIAESPEFAFTPSGSLQLRVEATGSRMSLFANGVAVLRHVLPAKLPLTQCGVFARSTHEVSFAAFRVHAVEKTAFVVMQFTPEYDQLYQQVIVPVCSSCGVKAIRADEIMGPGAILSDIVRQVQLSDLIVAEITPANPNVFYEVGYAHALQKPTILIAEKGRVLPFDLSPFRTIFYENTIGGKKRVEDALRSHIDAIFSS